MKLPESIEHLLHPKEKAKGVFLSLLLSSDGAAAAAWYVDPDRQPHSLGFASERVETDSWESRMEAADRAIAAVEEKLSETIRLQKVVLGMPADFLTETGDIDPSVRPQIKKLTRDLDLVPIGFVALHQAIVYKLKKDEGVPASVILLGVATRGYVVSVYKVGALVGERRIEKTEGLAVSLEEALKSFKEVEVLPSRILIYGTDETSLEETKTILLRHPWPTKANFLHFPKIETVDPKNSLMAVSLAGASELAVAMGEEIEPTQVETPSTVSVPEEETSNVAEVSPEALGFHKGDILEAQPRQPAEEEKKQPTKKFSFPFKLPAFSMPALPKVRFTLPNIAGRRSVVVIILIVTVVLGLLSSFSWSLPKAEVTLFVIPASVAASTSVTVDPTSTVVDEQKKILPGRKQEKTVSGEKTITVTGKKEVGDPARGAVTIYNKSLSSRTFKKGSVLTAASLAFTLDSDVQVASASESVGSITFGKGTGAITAAQIGPESNVSSGTEFTFKDLSTSIAVARNDQQLSGGTSREVTVVSRSDYDALVSQLTEELLEKAKGELATSVSGSEKLVDETIETEIAERSFAQEIDQEANQLNGKLTVTVSGVSYSEGDLTQILAEVAGDKVPTGYNLPPTQTEVTIAKVQVKKDSTITMTANLKGMAIPNLDTEAVRRSIAGKAMSAAQQHIKSVTGVGAAEFRLRWKIFGNRMPFNTRNISISIAVQE